MKRKLADEADNDWVASFRSTLPSPIQMTPLPGSFAAIAPASDSADSGSDVPMLAVSFCSAAVSSVLSALLDTSTFGSLPAAITVIV